MAFKTVDQFNKERGYDNYFSLRNDGDYADVVFLYRGTNDVLVADAHYIKSENYSGYVHCCGRGCPACGKGIAVRNKLFVPMYNFNTQKIEFWDRSMFFENQLNQDVFLKYPNPSEYVFRITRHGQARDVNTTYEIRVIGKNSDPSFSYNAILAKFHTSVPEVYNIVIREISAGELNSMLNNAPSAASTSSYTENSIPSYQVTPRAAYVPSNDNSSIPDFESIEGTDESIDDVPFEVLSSADSSDSLDDALPEPDFD